MWGFGNIKPAKNIFCMRTCACKASPGLGGVELAGSAGVHLNEDPVSLLRDVESRVQLVRTFVWWFPPAVCVCIKLKHKHLFFASSLLFAYFLFVNCEILNCFTVIRFLFLSVYNLHTSFIETPPTCQEWHRTIDCYHNTYCHHNRESEWHTWTQVMAHTRCWRWRPRRSVEQI